MSEMSQSWQISTGPSSLCESLLYCSYCCVSHRVETQKLQELQSATEKVRREKWIEEKTKKIKVWRFFVVIIILILISVVLILTVTSPPRSHLGRAHVTPNGIECTRPLHVLAVNVHWRQVQLLSHGYAASILRQILDTSVPKLNLYPKPNRA